MRISLDHFYAELKGITQQNIDIASRDYLHLTYEQLITKPSPEKWSVGECLQHLVAYGNYYLSAMENSVAKNGYPPANRDYFKPSYVGNKFAEMLRYKETGMKKMKSPTIKTLVFNKVDENIVAVFIKQQEKHLAILDKTAPLRLEKVKVPVALTKLIKTSIGDTLRFSIYHNERHIIQSQNVYNQLFK